MVQLIQLNLKLVIDILQYCELASLCPKLLKFFFIQMIILENELFSHTNDS